MEQASTPTAAPSTGPTPAAMAAAAAAKRLRLLALLNCTTAIAKGCGTALAPHMAATVGRVLSAVHAALPACGYSPAAFASASGDGQPTQAASEVAELCHHLDSILAAAAAARKPNAPDDPGPTSSDKTTDVVPACTAPSSAPASDGPATRQQEKISLMGDAGSCAGQAERPTTAGTPAGEPPLLADALQPLAALVQALLAAVGPGTHAASASASAATVVVVESTQGAARAAAVESQQPPPQQPVLSDVAAVLQLGHRALVLAQWQASGNRAAAPLPAPAVDLLMAPDAALSEARTSADAGERFLHSAMFKW